MSPYANKCLLLHTIFIQSYIMENIKSVSGLSPLDYQKEVDGKTVIFCALDGKTVIFCALRNNKGSELCVTNYGAKIVSLMVPDKEGKLVDVVLGHANIDDYLNSGEPTFGATCGRYANRIAKGKFQLDEFTWRLARLPFPCLGH